MRTKFYKATGSCSDTGAGGALSLFGGGGTGTGKITGSS